MLVKFTLLRYSKTEVPLSSRVCPKHVLLFLNHKNGAASVELQLSTRRYAEHE